MNTSHERQAATVQSVMESHRGGSRGPHRRGAFTLVELLAVIAIIGTLVGLLLPAVQSAREASRLSSCQNNLKQTGLGLQNFHDAKGTFPPGTVNQFNNVNPSLLTGSPNAGICGRSGWMQALLPFIEEAKLYDYFGSQNYFTNGVDRSIWLRGTTVISTLTCPSDPVQGKTSQQNFHGNVVLSAGSTIQGSSGTTLDGVFFAKSAIKIKDFLDGTSKTLLSGELLLMRDNIPGSSSHEVRGRYYNGIYGNTLFNAAETPNTTVGDNVGTYCSAGPMTPCAATQNTSSLATYARSMHPGGVNVGLADGAVRFVPNSVDATIWKNLANRRDGQTIGEY